MSAAKEVGSPSNGGKQVVEAGIPYIAHATITGSADLLFHSWNCEAVEEKSKASKGSDAKKSDNIESYIQRDESNLICLPSEYLRMSVVNAAKFRQDPRSPRKSAMELFKASIVSLSPLCPVVNRDGNPTSDWDYEHRCRVQIQRNSITRTRPAFKSGWSAEVSLMVMLPEYIDPSLLHEVMSSAGRLIGVGDFRPTYGRFQVSKFETQQD